MKYALILVLALSFNLSFRIAYADECAKEMVNVAAMPLPPLIKTFERTSEVFVSQKDGTVFQIVNIDNKSIRISALKPGVATPLHSIEIPTDILQYKLQFSENVTGGHAALTISLADGKYGVLDLRTFVYNDVDVTPLLAEAYPNQFKGNYVDSPFIGANKVERTHALFLQNLKGEYEVIASIAYPLPNTYFVKKNLVTGESFSFEVSSLDKANIYQSLEGHVFLHGQSGNQQRNISVYDVTKSPITKIFDQPLQDSSDRTNFDEAYFLKVIKGDVHIVGETTGGSTPGNIYHHVIDIYSGKSRTDKFPGKKGLIGGDTPLAINKDGQLITFDSYAVPFVGTAIKVTNLTTGKFSLYHYPKVKLLDSLIGDYNFLEGADGNQTLFVTAKAEKSPVLAIDIANKKSLGATPRPGDYDRLDTVFKADGQNLGLGRKGGDLILLNLSAPAPAPSAP